MKNLILLAALLISVDAFAQGSFVQYRANAKQATLSYSSDSYTKQGFVSQSQQRSRSRSYDSIVKDESQGTLQEQADRAAIEAQNAQLREQMRLEVEAAEATAAAQQVQNSGSGDSSGSIVGLGSNTGSSSGGLSGATTTSAGEVSLSPACRDAFDEALFQYNRFLFVPAGGASPNIAGGIECSFLLYLKRQSVACHDEYIEKRRTGVLVLTYNNSYGTITRRESHDPQYGLCAYGTGSGYGNDNTQIQLVDAGPMPENLLSRIYTPANYTVPSCLGIRITFIGTGGGLQSPGESCSVRSSTIGISNYRHLRCDLSEVDGLPTHCYPGSVQIDRAIDHNTRVCRGMLRPENIAHYTSTAPAEVTYCQDLLN